MTRQEEIEELLEAHMRRRHKLKVQKADAGPGVDPKITTEIEKIEAEIKDLQTELQALPESRDGWKREIPYVVVAMTRAEAEELFENDGNRLNQGDVSLFEKSQFEDFGAIIQDKLTNKEFFANHYGDHPDDWRPYLHNKYENTIRELVNEAASHEQMRSFSEKFLNGDAPERWRVWHTLGETGCIIFVDAVSIFHPVVYRRLLHSELGGNERVFPVVIIPSYLNDRGHKEILFNILRMRMQRAFYRSEEAAKTDDFCRHNIIGLDSLQNWLRDYTLKIAQKIVETPNSVALQQMRNEVPDSPEELDENITGGQS